MSARRKPAIMFQGTGSDVGKSLIVAGLCRAAARRGITVRPFKPQNMSNNAAVTVENGEIGRAQALQARACGVAPSIHMNPVLLKPESEGGAQLVIRGERLGTRSARDYGAEKGTLMPAVLESFQALSAEAELIFVEGAGSPAEVNLRSGDIANMGFAEAADIPVILIGDIERGGVIAGMVGTHVLLSPSERQRVSGFLINKFRGDARLFDTGMDAIVARTGWNGLGVVPYFPDLAKLPAEDSLALDTTGSGSTGGVQTGNAIVRIAVPRLPRIANFDDLDPLRAEPQVGVVMVQPGDAIPADVDLIILPGSKATIGDMNFLRAQGWDIDILAHVRRGGHVVGICGGFQMLGAAIDDPNGIEGAPESVTGLNLLPMRTTITPDKKLVEVDGVHIPTGQVISGYEIHCGRTDGEALVRPLLDLNGRPDGAISQDGRISGCYVHGLFAADGFRRALIRTLGGTAISSLVYQEMVDTVLDRWADHLEAHLDVPYILSRAGVRL